jgi:hypothetical protein
LESETISALSTSESVRFCSLRKACLWLYRDSFANIFINPDAQHERFEDDIFPRSFILNIRPLVNVGPARVFGLEGDPDAGIEGLPGLPLSISLTITPRTPSCA